MASQVLDCPMMATESEFRRRIDLVRARMSDRTIDTLLVSVGRDMPYLIGYEAMPLERLTMLVIPMDGPSTLVVPALEEPRVSPMPGLFDIIPWGETTEPLDIVAGLCGDDRRIAVGDQMWARFLVGLVERLPGVTWLRSSDVVGPARMVKGPQEVSALRAAAQAVDRIAERLQTGQIPLIGRSEAEVSADLSAQIVAEGHERVNFAIVAAGPNAASPHHHPGDRIIGPNEIVLCDFGGTMNGYCSDITRCVVTGDIDAEIGAAWAALQQSQEAGVQAGVVGSACAEVDRAARSVLVDAGYGEYFVHRTGHGIGMEEHEEPYMVEGAEALIEAGHAFSVEPGIYVPGRWGMRLEDIVVATLDGPVRLNEASHELFSVRA
ncbi:MAG: Xaa-Pro peptidase family protein [Actinomycetota bacterium]|jgi:Xaa-Pro aminopeptidase|nr:Xaa-Pro peptidase family protein [Actinomycetota bacterium]MDA3015854.1 Xaa-Pro peptidase family protein [Actinomycetota bacterium]